MWIIGITFVLNLVLTFAGGWESRLLPGMGIAGIWIVWAVLAVVGLLWGMGDQAKHEARMREYKEEQDYEYYPYKDTICKLCCKEIDKKHDDDAYCSDDCKKSFESMSEEAQKFIESLDKKYGDRD